MEPSHASEPPASDAGAPLQLSVVEEVMAFCHRQAVGVQGVPALRPRRRKRARNEPIPAQTCAATHSQTLETSGALPPDSPHASMNEAHASSSRPYGLSSRPVGDPLPRDSPRESMDGALLSSSRPAGGLLPLPPPSRSFASRKRKAASSNSDGDLDDVPIAAARHKLSRITKLAHLPQVLLLYLTCQPRFAHLQVGC